MQHCREFLNSPRHGEGARPRAWYEKTSFTLAAAAVLVPGVTIFGLGFIHIITGSNGMFSIEYKDSFGLSETFINIDRITGMPWVFAQAKHPIGCKVLQEHGYIESDKTFESRTKREFERKMANTHEEAATSLGQVPPQTQTRFEQ